MKNTYLELVDKLPAGMAELYAMVAEQAETVGANYLVVGAMARDLVLVHGFRSTLKRQTHDVDFGIEVASWDEFLTLREGLLAKGFTPDPQKLHKLYFTSADQLTWEMDIVPFGAIEDETASIRWPPDHDWEMCVLGFKEALHSALQARITPGVVIPVASPAGICLLKLVAWLDRETDKRAKDAADIQYLIHGYPRIPEIHDALFEEGLMQIHEFDELTAGSMKLGRDVASIISANTYAFLESNLFSVPEKTELLVREMSGRGERALQENLEIVRALIQGIRRFEEGK